jgi:hypothetical protein
MKNSKYDQKTQELIFVGTPFQCLVYIECKTPYYCLDEEPDLPQGLILQNNKGEGHYQQILNIPPRPYYLGR